MLDVLGHRGSLFINHRWSRAWRRDLHVSEGYPLEGPSYAWRGGMARSAGLHDSAYVSNESMEHYYFGGRTIFGMLNQRKGMLKLSEKIDLIFASREKAEQTN